MTGRRMFGSALRAVIRTVAICIGDLVQVTLDGAGEWLWDLHGRLPGSVMTPWFGLREGSVIPVKKAAEPSTARDPTSNSTNHKRRDTEHRNVTRRDPSAVHAATRCALAITTLLP